MGKPSHRLREPEFIYTKSHKSCLFVYITNQSVPTLEFEQTSPRPEPTLFRAAPMPRSYRFSRLAESAPHAIDKPPRAVVLIYEHLVTAELASTTRKPLVSSALSRIAT